MIRVVTEILTSDRRRWQIANIIMTNSDSGTVTGVDRVDEEKKEPKRNEGKPVTIGGEQVSGRYLPPADGIDVNNRDPTNMNQHLSVFDIILAFSVKAL